MTLKKKVFIIVNAIIQTVFFGFAIYFLCIGKYAGTMILSCSSIITLLSSIDIAMDMN